MNGPHEHCVVQDIEAPETTQDNARVVPAIWNRGPSPHASPGNAFERERVIARSIEVDIIPRLLMAHLERPLAEGATRPAKTFVPVIDDVQINDFADLVTQEPLSRAIERVSTLVESGVSLHSVFSDLFAQTARLLGERWLDDETSFLDVTLGLANLQQLLRHFGADFENVERREPNGCRLLLSAMPGEGHTFGIAVVEEYFRRDGWTVSMETPQRAQDLLGILRQNWYDVIGLSVGNAGATAALGQFIKDIRTASMNGGIKVILGGNALLIAEDSLKVSGADMLATSAEDAVRDARKFITNIRK